MPRRQMRKKAAAKTKVDKRQDKMIRKIYSEMIESKRYDNIEIADTAAYDTNNVTSLLTPAEGTNDTEMVGSKINPTRLEVRGSITGGDSSFSGICRVTILRSRQRFVPDNSVGTTTNGYLQFGGTSGAYISQFQKDNRSHFTVLYDKTFVVPPVTSNYRPVLFSFSKKLSGVTEFDLAGGGTLEKGQYYLCLTSDKTNASGDTPLVSWSSSIWYKDA